MKKLFAIVMVLMLLASTALVHADVQNVKIAEGYKLCVSNTGTYTIQIPQDYIAMDMNMKQLLTVAQSQANWEEYGLDAETGTALLNALSSIDMDNADLFYTPDLLGNINVMVIKDVGILPEQMEIFASAMDDQLLSLYGSMGVSAEDISFYGNQEIAGRVWYAYDVSFMGQYVLQFICFDDQGTQYQMTFTSIDPEEALNIASTFELTDAPAVPAAPASAANEDILLTSVTGMFTVRLPADFRVVDANFLNILQEVQRTGKWEEFGLTAANGEVISQAIAMVDLDHMDFAYAPNMAANVNVIVDPNTGLTPQILPIAKALLDNQIAQSYAGSGVTDSDITFHDLVELNDYVWYNYEVMMMGRHVTQYICFDDQGNQYQLTFTDIDEATTMSIVSSFQMVK